MVHTLNQPSKSHLQEGQEKWCIPSNSRGGGMLKTLGIITIQIVKGMAAK